MNSTTAPSWRTIKTATYQQELIFLRGRLEAEGIQCQLANEHTLSVQPFYANAIGGVRLEVREDQLIEALKIIDEIEKGTARFAYENETARVNQELKLRAFIRQHANSNELQAQEIFPEFPMLRYSEIMQIIQEEKERLTKRKNNTRWKRFLGFKQKKHFFDAEDLLALENLPDNSPGARCPHCGSHNTRYGYTSNTTLPIWGFIVSLFLVGGFPAPVFKKRHHCFECHREFTTPSHAE